MINSEDHKCYHIILDPHFIHPVVFEIFLFYFVDKTDLNNNVYSRHMMQKKRMIEKV